ncbi:molybdopterin biosynthesis protein [Bellilinea sp.]|uniref:molybdopterin biosynthesis protein n=1 Tax=Bellilinea sp. TaxID=2838785 RepID=UPI002ADD4491|nr:molybdopterin biosynthesis protein [Bellilinea sp.]
MSIYLQDIPLNEALARFDQALESAGLIGILGEETLELNEHLVGRVTTQPVWARISSPHYHAAAMDGFALRAEDVAGAMPTSPVILTVGQQAVYVDTGDPLPLWANAVVPIENVEALDENGQIMTDARCPRSIRLRAGLPPWSHVRPMGEDIVATQLVLPSGHILRPVDLGAVAAAGHDRISVSRKPRVAILPTGTELIEIGQPVETGRIIEFNSLVLAAQIRLWGGEAFRYPITPDENALIRQRVQEAAEQSDLILLNAGSSAGSEDFSAVVVQELGDLLVHGVAVRPGHPVILGMIRRQNGSQCPIIGVPGYPVSAALTGEIFVEPLLARWLGRPPYQPIEIEAKMTRKLTSPPGDDDYVRVVAGRVGDQLLAAPLSRGAGVITSLVRADGIVVLPRGVQGVEAGSRVRVRLYRPPEELNQTIFAIGSHDISLDLLAQYLAAYGRRLVSANVGSQGGLVALRRGETHLAGCHLLDTQSGVYNLAAVQQYLPGQKVRILGWVNRVQGLLVAKGNPKNIEGLQDLIRKDVMFVNRQRGAGTRILLDYQLGLLGISPLQIRGYGQEEYTHLAVAAAVASGRADCGLGIAAAAVALDLDFIPLFEEEYDLIIPAIYAEDDLLRPLFDLAADGSFRAAVGQLPGYDISRMGRWIQ